jgi:hypothetical protein
MELVKLIFYFVSGIHISMSIGNALLLIDMKLNEKDLRPRYQSAGKDFDKAYYVIFDEVFFLPSILVNVGRKACGYSHIRPSDYIR